MLSQTRYRNIHRAGRLSLGTLQPQPEVNAYDSLHAAADCGECCFYIDVYHCGDPLALNQTGKNQIFHDQNLTAILDCS